VEEKWKRGNFWSYEKKKNAYVGGFANGEETGWDREDKGEKKSYSLR